MSRTFDRRALLGGGIAAATVALVGGGTAAGAVAATHPQVRYGSSGGAVLELQRKLAAKGFWCGSPDGSFGGLTQQAVYAVQKAYGLTRDGVCGPNTWGAVDRLTQPKSWTQTYAVEIDLRRQLLMITGNGYARITLNTSTGSGQWFSYNGRWIRATTPTGWFSMLWHGSNGWDYGALGGLYRPYYFTRSGIAVHGSGSIPPYPASHGCCRVSTAAQDMLIASGHLRIGRGVLVHN
ncbi:L,D-transpeptidase family protein [Calidifontibacter sp. DB0510]|uniref:L,D-transpeptidase family protein n=1 Tax=Metallococcus carri TaxID=1656884 RepID=A0A967B3A8_9MICO|nr:peptidoglycan-binding domain-containing protein [Metallococcus carri]NHN56500.1 L,D-transpeptidase family protein [Metallococcus carri]NOP36124.1 L,D-transpeptidase family protein [Calidifontibacter sp. DB2511S]